MRELEIAPQEPYFEPSLDAWVLSRYADVRKALCDRRLSASGARAQADGGTLDEAAHREFRERAKEELSAAKVREWTDQLTPLADRMFRDLGAQEEIELVRECAEPWCLAAAATVTGTDLTRAATLNPLALEVFLAAAEPFDPDRERAGARATVKLAAALLTPLRVQTFVALSQSLPAFLANSWLTLLQHPEEALELQGEPERLPEAIDELLRYSTPARAQFRRALEDASIGGCTIAKGQRAILLLAAANRDPAEFPEPDRFDPRRRSAHHLAFGAGAHACLGAVLIRTQAVIATGAFLRHFAGAELCAPTEWRGGFALRAPARLPVRRQ